MGIILYPLFSMANLSKSTGSILFAVWSFLLALGWLLPNYHFPWQSFHSEMWVAVVLSLIVPFAIFKSPARISCDYFFVSLMVLALLPFVQFTFGQVAFFGHAWICGIYLVGLLVAILAGRFWESYEPAGLVDKLSLAFGIGALFSVFLQLSQWLELDGFGIWLINTGVARPSANFAQPNHLATFLLWGLLATFWGVIRAKLSIAVASMVALLLLFSIALTGSRTAWLAIGLIIIIVWWRHDLWASKRTSWVLTGLGLYFVFCVLALNFFNASDRVGQLANLPSDLRFAVWKVSLDAVMERPIFGYGWGQVAEAHISNALTHPPIHIVFAQSHNLFLDMVLWCGLPIGLLFSFVVLRWFWRVFSRLSSPEDVVLFLFLLVVANHAMLEYPLQYAYFLLPAGLIIGTVIARDHETKSFVVINKIHFVAAWLLSLVFLAVTWIDYLKVEHSYSLLRMESAGINLEIDPQPPKVIALTQWTHIFKHARVVPKDGMSEAELEGMRQVVLEAYKPLDFHKLVIALELNGRSEEAALWLERMCSVGPERSCVFVKAELETLKGEVSRGCRSTSQGCAQSP